MKKSQFCITPLYGCFRFGFVETLTREKEIFFHFSNVEGKTDNLGVGMEVEYTIFNREKGGKVSAEGVKVLTKGSIPPLKAKEEVLNGKVVRPLRSVNPDQEDYCGLIQVAEEGTSKYWPCYTMSSIRTTPNKYTRTYVSR